MTDVPSLNELFQAIPDAGAEVLEPLSQACVEHGAWRELFEVRLMQARVAAGLPVDLSEIPNEPAEVREQLEEAYRQACQEAGDGLLTQRNWRDAWRYLRAADQSAVMREALAAVQPTEEDAEELIEVALHEGACPEQGFRWLLQHCGTCNGVTTLDGVGPYLAPEDLRACVAVMIDWLTDELVSNVRQHIQRQESSLPESVDLPALIAERAWLFEQEAAHVDASHLAAVVRWSRVVESPDQIRKAVALADYGSRLHASLRYPDAPPFDAVYDANLLFLNAQLGSQEEEAVVYFRDKSQIDPSDFNAPACVESYLLLLTRLQRSGEALREWGRLTDAATPFTALLPKPLDLARESGDWESYDTLMRELGDPVGYAAGLIARRA